MIALLGFGACANLVLMEIAGSFGVPGVIFIPPLIVCVLGMGAAVGIGRRRL